MTAKEYLETKGIFDRDYMDSGMTDHISELMEEYHKAKQRAKLKSFSQLLREKRYIDEALKEFENQ